MTLQTTEPHWAGLIWNNFNVILKVTSVWSLSLSKHLISVTHLFKEGTHLAASRGISELPEPLLFCFAAIIARGQRREDRQWRDADADADADAGRARVRDISRDFTRED